MPDYLNSTAGIVTSLSNRNHGDRSQNECPKIHRAGPFADNQLSVCKIHTKLIDGVPYSRYATSSHNREDAPMAKKPAPIVNESDLSKGELRKLNALRKSLGQDIADNAFAKWLKEQPTEQAEPEDKNAQMVEEAFGPVDREEGPAYSQDRLSGQARPWPRDRGTASGLIYGFPAGFADQTHTLCQVRILFEPGPPFRA